MRMCTIEPREPNLRRGISSRISATPHTWINRLPAIRYHTISMNPKLPLAFACSGCSNSGQLANYVALELDRLRLAEMSCLAGVGAGKSHFLKQLKDHETWIIDGCPIECALGIFNQMQKGVDSHIRLHELGVRKNSPIPSGEAFANFIGEVIEYINAKTNMAPAEPFFVHPPESPAAHCNPNLRN